MIGGRTAAGRNRGRTGGRLAEDSGGRSGRGWRGVSRNRGRQIVAVVAAAYAGAGGGAHSCRPRGQRKPPAGRGTAGTAGTATGSRQPGDRTATTAPGRDGPPPAGAEQATKARANASGQAEDYSKRARTLARPREVGTPAPAKGTAGTQAKTCGFKSAKFF